MRCTTEKKKLYDEDLDQVTGGTGRDDIVAIDEDPFPWLKKYWNDNPAGGNYDPYPENELLSESGESLWWPKKNSRYSPESTVIFDVPKEESDKQTTKQEPGRRELDYRLSKWILKNIEQLLEPDEIETIWTELLPFYDPTTASVENVCENTDAPLGNYQKPSREDGDNCQTKYSFRFTSDTI